MTRALSAVTGAGRDGVAAARYLARWLALAATPTFAVMALLTAPVGDAAGGMLCAAGHGSWLDGMMPMYLLMSVFHAGAWLKLISQSTGG